MSTVRNVLLSLFAVFGSSLGYAGPGSIPILDLRNMLATIPLEGGCTISALQIRDQPRRLVFRLTQGERSLFVRVNETPDDLNFEIIAGSCLAKDATWRLRLDDADKIEHWVWAIDTKKHRTREFSLTVDGPDGYETFQCDSAQPSTI